MLKQYILVKLYRDEQPRTGPIHSSGCTTIEEFRAKYGGDFFNPPHPIGYYSPTEGYRLWKTGESEHFGDSLRWVQVPAEEVVAAQ